MRATTSALSADGGYQRTRSKSTTSRPGQGVLTYGMMKLIYSRSAAGATHGKEVVREVRLDKDGKLRILVANKRWRLAENAECYFCGKPFVRTINRKHPGLFCSDECRSRNRHKEAIKRMVWKKCSVCWRNFKVRACVAHRYSTCRSPDCSFVMRQQQAKLRQGKGNFGQYNGRPRNRDGKFAVQ